MGRLRVSTHRPRYNDHSCLPGARPPVILHYHDVDISVNHHHYHFRRCHHKPPLAYFTTRLFLFSISQCIDTNISWYQLSCSPSLLLVAPFLLSAMLVINVIELLKMSESQYLG